MYIWYQPSMECNYIYYVYVVPAEHWEDDMTSQYYLCDHKYYIYVVLADHGKDDMTGWYHLCNHDTKGKWVSKRKPQDGLVWTGHYKTGLIHLQISLDKQ